MGNLKKSQFQVKKKKKSDDFLTSGRWKIPTGHMSPKSIATDTIPTCIKINQSIGGHVSYRSDTLAATGWELYSRLFCSMN